MGEVSSEFVVPLNLPQTKCFLRKEIHNFVQVFFSSDARMAWFTEAYKTCILAHVNGSHLSKILTHFMNYTLYV